MTCVRRKNLQSLDVNKIFQDFETDHFVTLSFIDKVIDHCKRVQYRCPNCMGIDHDLPMRLQQVDAFHSAGTALSGVVCHSTRSPLSRLSSSFVWTYPGRIGGECLTNRECVLLVFGRDLNGRSEC